MRIKSSKAFPPSEIAVIEDMVLKVKEAQVERERRFRENPNEDPFESLFKQNGSQSSLHSARNSSVGGNIKS